jgi:hypothetical protein
VRRRTALRAIAGTVAAALVGCSDPGNDGGFGTVDEMDWNGTPTPRRARPAIQERFEFDPPASEPAGVTEIGSRDSVANPDDRLPWRVLVWNDDDSAGDISLAVFGESAGRTVDRTLSVPAGTYHEVELLAPDRYAVQVQRGEHQRYEFHVARDAFDCNRHTAEMRVSPTGLVQYVTTSTMVACGFPTETE